MAGVLAPEVEQIGVQRLAGRGAVLQAGQVEGVHVHLGHEAVHRRRAAERRHAVAADEGEDLGRIVAVEVVGEHRGLHEPLAENLPQTALPQPVSAMVKCSPSGFTLCQCLAVMRCASA